VFSAGERPVRLSKTKKRSHPDFKNRWLPPDNIPESKFPEQQHKEDGHRKKMGDGLAPARIIGLETPCPPSHGKHAGIPTQTSFFQPESRTTSNPGEGNEKKDRPKAKAGGALLQTSTPKVKKPLKEAAPANPPPHPRRNPMQKKPDRKNSGPPTKKPPGSTSPYPPMALNRLKTKRLGGAGPTGKHQCLPAPAPYRSR